MKVGIVTWHKGNIGSSLQAYALYQKVRELGYEPELINLIKSRKEPLVKVLRSSVFHMRYLKSGLTRDNTYRFIDRFVNQTPNMLYEELKEYAKNYNAVICGSDQIWNCVGFVEPYYFLQFVEKQKRISYAPSIAVSKIEDQCRKDFITYVSSIPYLSVREDNGARIIKELTGLDAKIVLDPTLLLKPEEWLSLAQNIDLKKRFGLERGEYVLCYYLGDQQLYSEYTKRLLKITGKKVRYVSFKRKNFGKNQIVCTVEEFIALIRDSFCVLTDSFHGTVIPLNIGKKVGVFERFSQDNPLSENSRIYNILHKFNIENWMLSTSSDVTGFINRKDNVIAIQEHISMERDNSIEYLQDSLRKVCF